MYIETMYMYINEGRLKHRFQTAFFQFGHGSLEAFYLDFLNRQVAP